MRIPCSVPILTLNSKERLTQLLPLLVEYFEDVFIVDGNSTDGTREYARSIGVRVERQSDSDVPDLRITDFTAARFRSWSLARHDWVFIVDADEIPSPECSARVATIIDSNDQMIAHRFKRLARLPDGRVVMHAFFYPEYTMIRLFDRRSGITLEPKRKVHERFVTPAGVTVTVHEEALLHTWPAPDAFQQKLDQYVALEFQEGQRGLWSVLRWVIWYNVRSAIGQLVRATWTSIIGALQGEVVLPWSYTLPMIGYRFRIMGQGLRNSRRQTHT